MVSKDYFFFRIMATASFYIIFNKGRRRSNYTVELSDPLPENATVSVFLNTALRNLNYKLIYDKFWS